MQTLQDLRQGFQNFKDNLSHIEKRHYQTLALGQSPRIFVISCADSRVDPTAIFSAIPGEIFTVRNVANLIPPCNADGESHGTSAALEFAVTALKVNIILILGHSCCGGIRACLEQDENTYVGDFIGPWVKIASKARQKVLLEFPDADKDTQSAYLEKEAIKLSLDNLKTFPFIHKALEEKNLTLAGAVFKLENAELEWILDE